MIRKFILVLLALAIPVEIWGACSGSSPTWTSADATKVEVEACITAASTGDTINIPAGTETWSGNVTIPNAKALSIIGAGKTSTVITGASFTLGRSGSRISAMAFTDGTLLSEGYGFRIDNCKFTKTGAWGDIIIVRNLNSNSPDPPYGLIHACEFVNIRILINGTNMMLADGDHTAQNDLWLLSNDFGAYNNNVVYVENNTFSGGHSVDGNYGAKYVFRFNTVTGGLGIEAHGGQQRMLRGWEIYKNTLTDDASAYMMMYIRGGTGFVWGNTLSGVDSRFTVNRVYEGSLCNGTNAWDGNEITSGNGAGYPCRDQIGRAYDTELWVYSPPGVYTQTLVPAYSWLNRDGGVRETFNIVGGAEYHIVADRDYYEEGASFDGTSGVGTGLLASRPSTCTTGVAYWATDQGSWNGSGSGGQGVLYKCTATNTWTTYYTPYTYPHPLVGGSTPSPSIPSHDFEIHIHRD